MKLKEYIDQKRGRSTMLAKALQVSASFMSQMASGKAAISTDRAVLIEENAEGLVTRKDIFDDWQNHWPELRGETHVTPKK